MKLTIAQRVSNLSELEIRNAVAQSHCWTQVAVELGFHRSSGSLVKMILNNIQTKYDLDTRHFDPMKKNRRYERISKLCPICGTSFSALKDHPRESTTCSYSCSNTLFRSGSNNGTYCKRKRRIEMGGATYCEICWEHHEKKCVICNEKLIVEAHHYNDNHDDNRSENFVPLCPTHHQYWHSKHRHLIKETVDTYVKTFIEQRLSL